MEISKMLTISTVHIHPYHAKFLDDELQQGKIEIVVYEKGEYGWFVYTGEVTFEDWNELEIPFSIKDCMMLARNNGCDWLCLDRDGELVDDLPEYEW